MSLCFYSFNAAALNPEALLEHTNCSSLFSSDCHTRNLSITVDVFSRSYLSFKHATFRKVRKRFLINLLRKKLPYLKRNIFLLLESPFSVLETAKHEQILLIHKQTLFSECFSSTSINTHLSEWISRL